MTSLPWSTALSAPQPITLFIAEKPPDCSAPPPVSAEIIRTYGQPDEFDGEPISDPRRDETDTQFAAVAKPVVNRQPSNGATCTIRPHDLRPQLIAAGVEELHVPNLEATPHQDTLLALIQGEHPLLSIVIESMRFDLTDVLDNQLAQLVLVLSKNQAHQAPPARRHVIGHR